MKKILLLLGFALSSATLFSQTKMVHGAITNSGEKPIKNVTVSALGTDITSLSDSNGLYRIELPDSITQLIYSHPDMRESSSEIWESNEVNIQMANKGSDEYYDISLQALLEMSISVGSTAEQNLLSATSTVSVVDNTMIKQYNLRSITEALQLISGINIDRTYLKRDLVTSRGIVQDHYMNKVLIMINNIPTWNSVTGEGVLQRVNINDVERIEVLKGPASVVYGTNAYTCAVNVILKKEATNRCSINTEGTSTLGYKTHVNYIESNDNHSLLISASHGFDKGYQVSFTDEADSTNTLNEYLYGTIITAAVKSKNHTILLNAYKISESYLGVVPTFVRGAGISHELKGVLFNYGYNKHITEKLNFNYNFSFDRNSRDLARRANNSERSSIQGYRFVNSGRFDYDINKVLRIELGGDFERRQSDRYNNYDVQTDTIKAENNMSGLELWKYSLYSQLHLNFGKLKSIVGGRYIENEIFGNNISPRATVLYNLTPSNTIKLIYGKSFRAPSLFEQNFATAGNTVFGSKELMPETSTSIELVYLFSFNNVFLQLLAYNGSYQNRIYRQRTYYEPIGDTTNVYSNAAEFDAFGLEMEAKYLNPRIINAFLNVNYINGSDGDRYNNYFNFKMVPTFYLSAGLSRAYNNFNISGLLNYKGKTEGPIQEIKGQYAIDINLSHNLKLKGGNLFNKLSIKNINNSNYTTPEYVRRRNINGLFSGYGRIITYSLGIQF